jgi:hypothetical protein
MRVAPVAGGRQPFMILGLPHPISCVVHEWLSLREKPSGQFLGLIVMSH